MNDNKDVRRSLNHWTYIDHCESLKVAADENLQLFLELKTQRRFGGEAFRIKSVGLYRSTMLLYSLSVELILKARGLFEERVKIKEGNIKNYQAFLEKWGKRVNKHDYFKIINHYNISVTDREDEILRELIDFATWDGRFPFPIKENDIILHEKGELKTGKLNAKYKSDIENFIGNQIFIMKNEVN